LKSIANVVVFYVRFWRLFQFSNLWLAFFLYQLRLGLRGYHANNEKAPGYEKGIHNSWYYALADRYDHLQTYYPVKQSFYAREFPTSWYVSENVATDTPQFHEDLNP
jgi:hypothetical protein